VIAPVFATTIVQSLTDNGIPIPEKVLPTAENATRDDIQRLERLIEQLRT
jgi:hypothetical protein